MVRPHVEFGNSVWCPFKLGDIEEIEKIQKRASKLIISLKNKPHEERLMHLKLPTLKFRRMRGDMIEVFKLTHNIYDESIRSFVSSGVAFDCWQSFDVPSATASAEA